MCSELPLLLELALRCGDGATGDFVGGGLVAGCTRTREEANLTIQSAGFTLVKGDLRGLVRARQLSRA